MKKGVCGLRFLPGSRLVLEQLPEFQEKGPQKAGAQSVAVCVLTYGTGSFYLTSMFSLFPAGLFHRLDTHALGLASSGLIL